MRTILSSWIALACIAVFAQASADQAPKDILLTPAQVERDVELAVEAYERIHPGYTRYTSQDTLDAAWQSVVDEATANNGMTKGEFYVASNRALAMIRCDHTKAELSEDMAERRKTVPIYLPAKWTLVEDRALVEFTGEDSGLQFGDEILAIDGQPLSERIDAVLPLIPYDGKTDFVRTNQAAQSFEFRGGGVDHFGEFLWAANPTADLTIKRGDAEPQMITVDRITHPEWRALGAESATARNFKDAVTFERIGDNAAYLRVDTFVNYRQPVKPDTLYDPIFKAIKAEKRDTLILDLRNNGGGSDDASNRLIAHLISDKAPLMSDVRVKTLNIDGLRDHLWTWDSRALKPNPLGFTKNDDGTYSMRKLANDNLKALKPDKTAFKGKLIILTSSANSSASTHLMSFLKGQNPDAILIGEQTGGSAQGATAGLLFTLTLPESGIKMRIPMLQQFINVDSFEHGYGMSPDVEVNMTAADFLSGRDPAYERALVEAGQS
ncbi:MAG: S41 family peptidase [Pseudomonadota bacterium]